METWIPAIEIAAISLLFLLSANITISRRTVPLPAVNEKTGVTKMDILHEKSLTSISVATTLIYMAMFGHLVANFFTA